MSDKEFMCLNHDNTVSKIEKNGLYIRFGIGFFSVAFSIVLIVFGVLSAYSKENEKRINLNCNRISHQAGAYEQISKQLDRIERKLNGR